MLPGNQYGKRILEGGILRSCVAHRRAQRRDNMLAVRSEHDSPSVAELPHSADDAENKVTWAVVDGTSERTSWLTIQEVEHSHQLADLRIMKM